MIVTPAGTTKVLSFVQPLKAPAPMLVTPTGSCMVESALQLRKALAAMLSRRLFGANSTVLRRAAEHFAKAFDGMVVTLAGTTILPSVSTRVHRSTVEVLWGAAVVAADR